MSEARLPIILLPYASKELAKPRELYMDSDTKRLYAKDDNGDEIDFFSQISKSITSIDASDIDGIIEAGQGGTGISSLTPGSILYAETMNTFAETNSTEFGRSILAAINGSTVSGLSAEFVNGKKVNDTLADANSLWTAFKTKAYVDGLLSNNNAMVFKGILGTETGMVSALPTKSYSAGWSYFVGTAGTYAGQKCEVGDLAIAIKDYASTNVEKDSWHIIQANIDGSVTVDASTSKATNLVPIFSSSNGRIIKSSGKALPSGTIVGTTETGKVTKKLAMFGSDPSIIIDSGLEVDTENNKIIGLDVNIATADVAGTVKSSTENNKVSVDPETGIMTVNKISLDNLDLNGGGSSSGCFGVSSGGTGLTSMSSGQMLYYSGSGDALSKTTTTAFGRELLGMTSGTVKSGLNADQVDGYHAWQMQTLDSSGTTESNYIKAKYDSESLRYMLLSSDNSDNVQVRYASVAENLSSTLPVSKGGTGATTAAGALTNLGITASALELSYAKGVTSSIQTQLNNKAATSHASTSTTYGVSSATNYGHAKASGTTPKANGTASVGTETSSFARGDHVHPIQTSVSGNAGTATKLASARTITLSGGATGSTSFDGSSNVTLPVTKIDGTKISGMIPVECIPKSALSKIITVADDSARYALTSDDVNVGDTVKVTSTKLLYIVKDLSKLNTADGYEVYSAGIAAQVPWSGVTDKPASYPPSDHNHDSVYLKINATAVAANKWATARTITVSGAASGSVSIDGSKNVSLVLSSLNPSNISSAVPISKGGTGATTAEDALTNLGLTSTAEELNYCSGVTSSIQTQLNGKASTSHGNHVPTVQKASNSTFLRNDNTWQVVTPANIGAAAISHTHTKSQITDFPSSLPANGGNADTADALTVSAGSATQPIYFSDNGIPVKCTYTLGKSVPSDAKFTDTVYTLPAATSSTLGGVKVGSNITLSSGSISLTKANVTSALGYTPPTTNTTYSTMTGASSTADGASGLVPQPESGEQAKYLRGDGTWATPPDTNTTYSVATTSASGLMSSTDKSKLDGIASGANKITVDSSLSSTSTNPVQNKVINSALAGKLSTSGNAASATKLQTSRTIFGCSFNGTSNVTGTPTVSGVEISSSTPFIDFHFNNSTSDYTTRIIENSSGALTCTGTFSATKVYNAVFNDYAEWFIKKDINEKFETGDIIVYTKDGYSKSNTANSKLIVGAVSNSYGNILGGDALDDMECNRNKYIPVGLCGRIPIKVIGKVYEGDLIVSSDIPGVGMVNNDAKIGTIIGKAIGIKETCEIGLIKVLIMNI